MDQAAILSPYGTMTASGSSSTGIPLDKTRVDPRVRPLGDARSARRIRNGRGLGSQIDDVRRGLATKSSTPCKSLVYLVVHPSLIHIITLKYARTLHKRRPRDARTNAPPHAHTHHRRAARSHVCRHVCSNMQAVHMKPAQKAGDCTAHRRGIAPRGSRERRIAGWAPCAAPPAERPAREGKGVRGLVRKDVAVREGGEGGMQEGAAGVRGGDFCGQG